MSGIYSLRNILGFRMGQLERLRHRRAWRTNIKVSKSFNTSYVVCNTRTMAASVAKRDHSAAEYLESLASADIESVGGNDPEYGVLAA